MIKSLHTSNQLDLLKICFNGKRETKVGNPEEKKYSLPPNQLLCNVILRINNKHIVYIHYANCTYSMIFHFLTNLQVSRNLTFSVKKYGVYKN